MREKNFDICSKKNESKFIKERENSPIESIFLLGNILSNTDQILF